MMFNKVWLFKCVVVLILPIASSCNFSGSFQKELDKLDGPVVVFSPQEGDTLVVGQTLAIEAMLLLSQFNFEVDTIQVRLWHIFTKEEYILYLDQAPKASGIKMLHFTQTLTIPTTVSPGNDYRLSISGRSADKTVGLGFAMPVKVVEGP
ncbi:MAG: hypothetical protein GWN13_11610 [Phycisphaerae bacterium]|nr:hypothetical protein [Phycisphaerae bacterium]